jgi:competence ComEA-like helix-hairpin-helix protein
MIMIFFLIIDADIFELERVHDLEIIYADIEALRQAPLNINTASVQDLQRIPYLSLTECMKIIDYREKHGLYSSIDDLKSIPGFDQLLIDDIRPFLTLTPQLTTIDEATCRFRIHTSLPGDASSREIYTRATAAAGPYHVVLVTEKDAYESSFFDYCAPGIVIHEGHRTYALGKYNIDSGAGIMLSPLGSVFRSFDIRLRVDERGIMPYTSVTENGGFFGAALSDSLYFRYTLFYSHQRLDGRIDTLGYATSFDNTGDHVDSLSLSRKDQISEEIYGAVLTRRFADVKLSTRFYQCSYEPGFMCDDSLDHFYGSQFWMADCGFEYSAPSFLYFLEVARTFNDKIGGISGVTSCFPHVDLSLVGKYFPAGYYSPKGVEASSDHVEGLFLISHRSKIIAANAAFTLDRNTQDDTLVHGFRLNVEKKIGLFATKAHIRWRMTANIQDLAGMRVFLRATPLKWFFLDVRLEEKFARDEGVIEKGRFGALELGVHFKHIQARIRYGLFSTPSYASRIYAYEIDLPGIVNNRMLYGEGCYGFAYLSIKPLPALKLTIKYAMIEKNDVQDRHLGCQVDVRIQ